MKKIFILAYSKMNVGDDLFVNILVNRYPDVMFYSRAINTNFPVYTQNKNLEFLDKNLDQLLEEDISDFSAFVYIGGSIFMENAGGIQRIEKLNKLVQKCKSHNIPFFYISCNFGPYTTEEFKLEVEDLLRNTTDACFRDINSYNEFEHIKSVRYSPDVVFSYEKQCNMKPGTVGISAINFKYRENQKQYETKYYQTLINSILTFIESGKEVFLFSFCEFEGDEDTIEYICKNIPEKYQNKIHQINYRGNLEEFLELFSQMEYMICSRFHAMVLSHIFKQKKYILSYSKKIDNVIEDLKICDNNFNIEEISKKNSIDINEFEYKEFDNNIKIMAEKQFYMLDQYLAK